VFTIRNLFEMKKKHLVHAKLYIDVIISDNGVQYLYKQNKFDKNGDRTVLKEVLNKVFDLGQKEKYLFEKNIIEAQKLDNYLKTQKRVLEKHQKARNYDASIIVKNSIDTIADFKNDFDIWFKKNKK